MSGAGKKKKAEGQGKIPAIKKYRPGGSCAECKRLKIKCTRSSQDSFPCDSCIRRGCQSICPEGSLTTGKTGNRFVLANTEELHQRILELSNRIRELEDALQELQASCSTELHPLLHKDFLLIKAPLESGTVLADGEGSPDELESLDAFGSLSLRKYGRSNFHAQTAGSWYLLQNEDPDPVAPQDEVDTDVQYPLPVEILYAQHTFPLGTLEDTLHDLRARIQDFIPDRGIGTQLVENYFRGMAWMYDPVPRPLFNETIFDAVYTPYFPLVRNSDSTVLSVFFMVLAIGTLLDLDIPNYSPQATRYYQLARASLSLDFVMDEPPIPTIQALHLMGFFLHMSDSKGGFGTSWALMGLTSKLATAMGLHRDSAKWNLGQEGEIRRQVFWELYTYDTWQSMPCGRPPSFHRSSVECKMPYASPQADDDPRNAFKAWKHRFCYERIGPMAEQSFGARAPPYATILLLDRKIRDDPVPPILQLGSALAAPTDHVDDAPLTMQRYAVLCVREISLLLIHRPFFAQAATEKAPLESRFALSILAVYRSSCAIITGVRALYDQQPKLSPRVWFFWAHVYSASICLGGLVARCPSLSLASSALAQMDSACELFSKITDSYRVSKSLPSMLKLREKARYALSQTLAGQKMPLTEQQQDELSALVGETRLVIHRSQLLSPAQSTYGSANSPDVQPSQYDPQIHLPDSMQTYTDRPHGDYMAQLEAINAVASYQTPYPFHGHPGFEKDHRSLPQPSLPYPVHDEYFYLPQYAPQPPEQQILTEQHGQHDMTWHNFMSQLDMEFS